MFEGIRRGMVGRYDSGTLIVDTAEVSDGSRPYETGVSHPEYNEGKWVIVEAYHTWDAAMKGHEKWVATMTSEDLPTSLKDCLNGEISQLLDMISIVGGQPDWKEYPRTITINSSDEERKLLS